MVPVSLVGVYPIGPESFMCALLEWEDEGRFVPLWLPPIEGAMLAARLEEWEPRRPDAHDVLADLIGQATAGLSSIELTSYHEGMFVATLTLDGGQEIDMRPSDALLLALISDVQLEADETVLHQASIYLTAHDAQEFFGLERDDDLGEELDAESFAEFMRELGVDEDSFDVPGDDGDGDLS